MANDHVEDVLEAYAAGTSIDTSTLDFGDYEWAEGAAYSLATSAIRAATQVFKTMPRAIQMWPLSR